MQITMKAAGAAILAFGLIGPSAANAVPTFTPTFSASAGTGTETFTAATGLQTTDFLAQFNIPQFNASLGTLTSLSVSVSGNMSAVGSVTNSGSGGATNVVLTENSTVTDNPVQPIAGSFGGSNITTGSPNGDTFLLFTNSASVGAFVGSVGANGGTVSGIPLSGAFTTQTLTQSTGFDPNLLGAGTFGILFATGEFTTSGGSGGNLSNTVATQDGLTLSVTYNFSPAGPSPVPEPASLTLMATGMMGIAAAVRRRRKV